MTTHQKAVPKQKKLKHLYSTITAKEAQLCFKDNLITKNENKDFECITPGCTAPITCQSMTNLKNTAFFIDGIRIKNLHSPTCPYSEINIKIKEKRGNKEQESNYEPSGVTVMDTKGGRMSNGLGFPTTPSKSGKEIVLESESNKAEGNRKNGVNSKKKNFDVPTRQRKSHLKTIGQMIVQYEEDKNFVINEGFLGFNIPIYRYFLPITKNHLKTTKHYDRIPIYHGRGAVSLSKKGYYQFHFTDGISLPSNRVYKAHFFAPKDFIDLYFPFIQNHLGRSSKPLNIYIQSRFWLGNTKSGESVLRFQHRGKELLSHIYFTEG